MKTPFDSTKPLNRAARRAQRHRAKAANQNEKAKIPLTVKCGPITGRADLALPEIVDIAMETDDDLRKLFPGPDFCSSLCQTFIDAIHTYKLDAETLALFIPSVAAWLAMSGPCAPLIAAGEIVACTFVIEPPSAENADIMIYFSAERLRRAANDNGSSNRKQVR